MLMAGIAVYFPDAGIAAGMPDYLASSWSKLTSTLTEALNLRDKHETLPDSAVLRADKGSNAKKINALLGQAAKILLDGEVNDLRKQALILQSDIPALQIKRDSLRNKRLSAPDSSKLPWVATRSKIDGKITDLEKDIKEKEKTLLDINVKIAGELRKLGLKMDDRQIDIFLTSVTGDDLFQNTIIFANVKLVVEKLAELSREDRDNLEINRRYTGMYLVLNDLLIAAHEGLIEKIDDDYKPRLALVRAEAEKSYTEAIERSKQNQYLPAQRDAFKANSEANALTIRVAKLYSELLENQRKNVIVTLTELSRSRDVAENTYQTVRNTGDLRSLIRSGLELFDSIQTLSMPQLQPFENEAIRKEFEELNKRLKR
jgi:hypothetical protein